MIHAIARFFLLMHFIQLSHPSAFFRHSPPAPCLYGDTRQALRKISESWFSLLQWVIKWLPQRPKNRPCNERCLMILRYCEVYVSISSPKKNTSKPNKTLGMGRHFHSVLCCAIDAKFVGLVPCKLESKLMMGYRVKTQANETKTSKQTKKQKSGKKKTEINIRWKIWGAFQRSSPFSQPLRAFNLEKTVHIFWISGNGR